MSGSSLGFVVEALVALLLIVTIGYCFIVNKKLEQLRSDKSELRAIVCDLHRATGQAEQAIGALGETADSVEQTLSSRIARAQDLGARLDAGLEKGEALLSKLTVIARTASKRGAGGPADRPAREVSAAAPRKPFRHNEMGLGLLNTQRRETAAGSDAVKDVA